MGCFLPGFCSASANNFRVLGQTLAQLRIWGHVSFVMQLKEVEPVRFGIHPASRLKLLPALVSASRSLRLTILDAVSAISYFSTDAVMLALASFFSANCRRTLNPKSFGTAECECRSRSTGDFTWLDAFM